MRGFNELVDLVIQAGCRARAMQQSISREKKPDGSIITEADLTIDAMIRPALQKLYPGSLLVSEESETTEGWNSFDSETHQGEERSLETTRTNRYIFVLDPIDGTDVFSQGMPGWCVALGILNSKREPIGSILYAPNWETGGKQIPLPTKEGENYAQETPTGVNALPPHGTLFTSIGTSGAYVNGSLLPPKEQNMGDAPQLMASSRAHKHFDLYHYPHKVRNIGSNIMHMLAGAIYPNIGGCLMYGCFVWDIAPAHHFLRSAGQDIGSLTEEKNLSYQESGFLYKKEALRGAYLSGVPEYQGFGRKYILPR